MIAWYKSMLANDHPWTRVRCTKPALKLVWNRDDSLKASGFALNTLGSRVQVLFGQQGMKPFMTVAVG